jgi:hypothetical protein
VTANEAAIRKAYQFAENKDVVGGVNCFTKDGTFTDESIGVTYRGPNTAQPWHILKHPESPALRSAKGLRFRATTQAALATAVMILPSFARNTVRSSVARRLIT